MSPGLGAASRGLELGHHLAGLVHAEDDDVAGVGPGEAVADRGDLVEDDLDVPDFLK